jgi:hypothetical protein
MDLAEAAFALNTQWPTFMLQDPQSRVYADNLEAFLDWTWLVVSTKDPTELLARILAVPFYWDQPLEELPDRGWDDAIERAVRTRSLGHEPNTVCALEITLANKARGQGLSSACIDHLRLVAQERGMVNFVAPVRPTSKVNYCSESMDQFLTRIGPDGLSADPWLRAHQRLGAEIVKIAPLSMTIVGTFDDWFQWTNLDFRQFGVTAEVNGGLVPVLIDHSNELGVYLEPNVWVRHKVTNLQHESLRARQSLNRSQTD